MKKYLRFFVILALLVPGVAIVCNCCYAHAAASEPGLVNPSPTCCPHVLLDATKDRCKIERADNARIVPTQVSLFSPFTNFEILKTDAPKNASVDFTGSSGSGISPNVPLYLANRALLI